MRDRNHGHHDHNSELEKLMSRMPGPGIDHLVRGGRCSKKGGRLRKLEK